MVSRALSHPWSNPFVHAFSRVSTSRVIPFVVKIVFVFFAQLYAGQHFKSLYIRGKVTGQIFEQLHLFNLNKKYAHCPVRWYGII